MTVVFSKTRVMYSIVMLTLLILNLLTGVVFCGVNDESTLVKLKILNWLNFKRKNEPVTIGLPLPIGDLYSIDNAKLLNQNFEEIPAQFKPLARWPDGSIMWMLWRTRFTCC
ncbi:MAG: hypothetical protein B6U95_04185 [Thermofilum sp. ex4484_82]|nr:MAG: hypothetical protein B6U95_04185 [Thermofilum sp. ex4484_82]OYT38545.1 MAG: hypothetical protein B6U96_04180 [Archaeoglobales archaeon ex4484_92]